MPLRPAGARALAKHTQSETSHVFWEAASGPDCLMNTIANRVMAKVMANAVWINLHTPAPRHSSRQRNTGALSTTTTGPSYSSATTPRVGSVDSATGAGEAMAGSPNGSAPVHDPVGDEGQTNEGGVDASDPSGSSSSSGQPSVLEMRVAEGYGMRWRVDNLSGAVTFRGFLEPRQPV